jgi:hypothetical protein
MAKRRCTLHAQGHRRDWDSCESSKGRDNRLDPPSLAGEPGRYRRTAVPQLPRCVLAHDWLPALRPDRYVPPLGASRWPVHWPTLSLLAQLVNA